MQKDYALLSALGDLEGTVIYDYLVGMYLSALTTFIETGDELTLYRMQGEVRLLKRLLKEIETAEDEKIKLREREGKPNSRNLF